MPAELHDLRILLRAVLGDSRAISFDNSDRDLEGVEILEWNLLRVQLPHDDTERVDIGLSIVGLLLENLRGNPGDSTNVTSHVLVLGREDSRQAEIAHLGVEFVIHKQVYTLQVAVNQVAVVQILHSTRGLQSELQNLSVSHVP